MPIKLGAGLLLLVLALAVQQGYAEAAPKGWKCQYSIYGPFDWRRGPRFYYCYGTSLPNTRERMKARCRALDVYECLPGPCFPLEFAPGKSCER
jgi:hypothetical protein